MCIQLSHVVDAPPPVLEPYARPFVPEAEPIRLFSLIYRIKSGNLFRRQLFVIEGKNFLSNRVTLTESRVNDMVAAILDLNLEAQQVFPMVERLDRQKIPYLFALSGDPIDADMNFSGFVLSERPAALDHIGKALFDIPDKET